MRSPQRSSLLEAKQSLVNFPEGRLRAWLGRSPWDGQSKAAFEPIKGQEAYHLQWGENTTAEQKREGTPASARHAWRTLTFLSRSAHLQTKTHTHIIISL